MESVKDYSVEERLKHLLEWRNSGLLLSSYSKQTGIPIKTLRNWTTTEKRSAGRQQNKMSGFFLPVSICDEPGESACEIIIEFPKGIRITLKGSVRAEFI
jgi:hypothetical protein